ncbi:MAG: type II secretion system protein GspK [Alphaproteobacteria bacterium]|nr:type II secretion system protein GspK [Alphaproteobacteria bacterium]
MLDSARYHRSGRKGFALVSVLWGLVILSLIAAGMLRLRETASHLEHNARHRAELALAAQSGINRAILGILDTRADKRWRVDNVPIQFTFNGVPLTISIQDESGKIDLNAADKDVLTRLFRSTDLKSDEISALVDRVLDWRESNDLKHLNGANTEDYRASNAAHRPRHGPFQSVNELKLVLGITPDLFRRLEPAVTVYSQRQQINRETAPFEVLLTIPGMTRESAEKLIKDRLNPTRSPDSSSPQLPRGIIDPALPLAGRSFTIKATGKAGQQEVSSEETIRVTSSASRPFMVLMWK